MDTNTTSALQRAMASCDDVDHLIHAAWMAAGSMNEDGRTAERDALQAVIHLAGEHLQDVRLALRKAGVA
ncbi:MAG: hypothetical protein WBA88_14485 [Pseudaminobacter sp.]